jgi:hypothetical protein
MKKIFFLLTILLLFILSSCGQDYNSNYNDRGTYADIGIPSGTPLYNSYVIMQNKCFSCHGSQWQEYKTSDDWVNAGLIVKGNFNNSQIKLSLKNFGGSMPKDPASPLTNDEVDTLRTWVNSLQ